MTISKTTELHPFEPFIPPGAKVLMLGTFPPQPKRWSIPFYYPNFQNDMWRVMGLVFFDDKDHFIKGSAFDKESISSFCAEKGIALSDTARSVVRLRDNASDKYLRIVEPMNIGLLLDMMPECLAVVTTGQLATDTFCAATGSAPPPVGGYSGFTHGGRVLRHYRMPSTSRAYPKPLAEKAGEYARMFMETEILARRGDTSH